MGTSSTAGISHLTATFHIEETEERLEGMQRFRVGENKERNCIHRVTFTKKEIKLDPPESLNNVSLEPRGG